MTSRNTSAVEHNAAGFTSSWPLAAEKVSRYHGDGMLELGPFLSATEAADVRARIQQFVSVVIPALPARVRDKIIQYEPGTTDVVRRLHGLRQADPFFEALGASERFLSVARQLIDWEPLLYNVEMFFLAPNIGTGAHRHQEAGTFRDPAVHRSFNVWVALDDVPPEGGPLRYWLGSHKAGLLPRTVDELGKRIVSKEAADAAAREVRTFPVPRGHAIVHDGFTVHDSVQNRSPNPRMALLVQYRNDIQDLFADY